MFGTKRLSDVCAIQPFCNLPSSELGVCGGVQVWGVGRVGAGVGMWGCLGVCEDVGVWRCGCSCGGRCVGVNVGIWKCVVCVYLCGGDVWGVGESGGECGGYGYV